MTLLALAVLLGVAAGAWVVVPLLARSLALLGDAIPGGVLDAEARKRVALASLKEVEYDRVAGKLDEEDYRRLRAQLEREALLALRAAEGAGAAAAAEPAEPGATERSFTVTHACGFVNPPGSRFCSGCGRKLA